MDTQLEGLRAASGGEARCKYLIGRQMIVMAKDGIQRLHNAIWELCYL